MTEDEALAQFAIREASKDERPLKVGAVLVKGTLPNGTALDELLSTLDKERIIESDSFLIAAGFGAEISEEDHAESGLLERRLAARILKGARIYVTLEPCMNSKHWTRAGARASCAQIIKNRGIRTVGVGMDDPDSRILARGRRYLETEGIQVHDFPSDLRDQCEQLNKAWIDEQLKKWEYDQLFPALARRRAKRIPTSPRNPLNVKDCLTLLHCPFLEDKRGWPVTKLRIVHRGEFDVRTEDKRAYELYRTVFFLRKRFFDDNPKIMLDRRPWVTSDTPTLVLECKTTRYSYVQFYKDVVSASADRAKELSKEIALISEVPTATKDELIEYILSRKRQRPSEPEDLISKLEARDEAEIAFPHALCLHMVVVTADDRLLLVRRSAAAEYRKELWSVSFEEHMSVDDLGANGSNTMEVWVRRSLREELGIDGDSYSLEQCELLSVFLETDILNVSLVGWVKLNRDRDVLDEILRCVPRKDPTEMTAWSYHPYTDGALIPEILWQHLPYHPTSQYRMLLALMRKNGRPELTATHL